MLLNPKLPFFLATRRTKRNGPKTPAIISKEGKNVSNDVVQGNLYPSCKACFAAGLDCQWKTSVVHFRLSGIPNKAKNCENCVRKQIGCHLAWDGDESLKRPAQDNLEAESSKRPKSDDADLYAYMERIEKSIGKLVKFAASQAEKATKDHEETATMFKKIEESLEGLHEKMNDL